MPTTIALDDSGDVDLNGGLGPSLVSGVDAVRSFLIARFNTQAGEWGYNKDFGLPYNEAILGKFFDDVAAAGIYAQQVSRAPGVLLVTSGAVAFSLEPNTRKRSAVIDPIYVGSLTDDPMSFEVT